MCEFCTKHGDGQVWFKNAANYGRDLAADLRRRGYITEFFTSTIEEGVASLGRLESLYRRKGKLPARLTRAMVARAKGEHFGQVVTIEDIRTLVGKAATVVRLPCACRWAALKAENRCCYSVSYTPDAWYDDLDMGYFGLAQDEGLERISPATAIGQMEALEQDGAIHTIWTMMTPFIGAICNCRPADCLGLRTLALDVELMFRGEQLAVVDDQRCNGCGACAEACAEACAFQAIGSRATADGHRAVINPLQCYGCGLCRNSCPTNALSMTDRR